MPLFMQTYWPIIMYLGGFLIVALSAHHISNLFKKIKLPLITGLLIAGMLSGPWFFKLLPEEAIPKLGFLNELSLAFIAFAAGAELYLSELRNRLRSIVWNTLAQLLITFATGALAVYYFAGIIPFMKDMAPGARAAVAMLAATIFVARSPSSAIAVINELRAKGPFTQTAMGVTIVIDVLVIILFAICFSLSGTLLTGESFNFLIIPLLIGELALSFILGLALGKLLQGLLSLPMRKDLKTGLLLAAGFSIYLLSHFLRYWFLENLGHDLHIEPLLVCIVGSFYVANYTRYRDEFIELLHAVGPAIYAVFFTLTGASMSIDHLQKVWMIALILFAVRIGAMILAGYVGGLLSREPMRLNHIAWMPYLTQAGVAIGLTTEIAFDYPAWGQEFATVILAVIVINQIVGPPLFKFAITRAGEDHSRHAIPEFDGIRDALIFGLENQSLALARQLIAHGWEVRIVTRQELPPEYHPDGIEIVQIGEYTPEVMRQLDTKQAEAIVTMMDDEDNFIVCELAYEHLGTRDLIVRLNDPANLEKFRELGARIVEPSTAIVSLLDHYVRSPGATSLLLGLEKDQDSLELEVINPNLHGLALRDLRLPPDVLVLSIRRKGQLIITHGYTRLRAGDLVTIVGSLESLEQVSLRLS